MKKSVIKTLSFVILGIFLISLVSAWSVEITKLNDASIDTYYDEKVSIMSFKLNDVNCTDVAQVWYSNDSGIITSPKGCAESGGEVRLTSLDSIEGNNSWMIIVEHTDNTTQNTSVDFWVDSIYPSITINIPTLPDYFTNFIVPFDVDIFEINPMGVVYLSLWKSGAPASSWSWSPDLSSGANNIVNQTNPMSTEGLYSFNVSVQDNIGHWSSDGRWLYIDMTPPYYSNIINQSDNVYAEGKNYTFSIQWDDDLSGIDTVGFVLNGNSYPVTNIGNIYSAVVSDLAAITHNYTWSATDNAGNSNNTGTLEYTVVKATPVLNLNSNPSWNEDYKTETNVSEIGCPSQLTCDLYRNNVLVTEPDVEILGAGNYTYVYNTSGNQNYTNASTSDVLVIDKVSPEAGMSINGTSPIVYLTASDFQGNENNTEDGGCVYELYSNDTLVSNPDNTIYGVGTVNYIFNTTGCSNYTAGSISDTLTVTKAPQNVYLNINATNVIYGEAILVTCNGDLYRDGDAVPSENNTVLVLGAGTYNYSCVLNETENYQYNETSEIVVVNKIPSSIELYLNGNTSNLSVGYNEFFLIEGNVSGVPGTEEGHASLFIDSYPIEDIYLDINGKNISYYTFQTSGNHNITVAYESQNYSSSSKTYFVTVAAGPPPKSSSSGGGSCTTKWNCTSWSPWSECKDGEQNRTCLAWKRVKCGTGIRWQDLKKGETGSCMSSPYTIESLESQSNQGSSSESEEDEYGSKITGGTIGGFLKSGTGILTLSVIGILLGSWAILYFRRRATK